MKKLIPLLCLTLLLTACGGQTSPAPSELPSLTAEEAARAVLGTEAFSEQLEGIDSPIAAALYGIDEDKLLDCAAYLSTGATAEECTFLTVADEETAQEVLQGYQRRVEDQTAALENYQPAELPKLKEALTGSFALSEGVMTYLIVANDAAAAQDAVAEPVP